MSGFSPIEVIREVRIRPGIYNRDALVPPRREHKQQLWLEVAKNLTPPEQWENFTPAQKETRVGEVSNKWKNLRDHFYREIKLIESGDSNKKRKYIYFHEMEFVRPYIGYKLPPQSKRESFNKSFQESEDNDTDMEMETLLKVSDGETKYTPKSQKQPLRPTRSASYADKKYNTKTSKLNKTCASSSGQHSLKESVIDNFNILQKRDDSKNPTFKIRESDISFCLSLVPTLRELNGARKLSAKIDILKILHTNLEEIECQERKPTLRRRREYEEMSEDSEDESYSKRDPLNSSTKKKYWRTYK